MAKTPILTKDGLVRYDENIKDYIDTGLESKVSKTDIVNNLVSTDVDAPLSAMQGKILKDTIDRLEVPGAVIYRGTIGTDGDITELPSTYKRGDMYRVITEGTYSEQECEVGDFLFCTRDNILTVATLPDYDENRYKRYIMYQKYNPQTGANGEIIFAAYSFYMTGTAHLNRAYYDIKNGVKQLYSPDSFYVYYHSTTDNGVTWTALNHHYGDLKDAIFIETETEAIRILNTVEEIYNNENAIIYSPNPWGLSGYATDWAVIQGNLEDMIGEGAIYIDPDETSTEIENIDSVTSAKYVSYSNANSGLEATNVQEAIDTVSSISKGKNRARVFATTEDMNAWLSDEANKGVAIVGDNLYIVELDVPDWWISEVLEEPNEDGRYYKIAQLETQKVDLTTIESELDSKVSKTDVIDNLTTAATNYPLSANQGRILSDRIAGHLMYGWKYLQSGALDPIYIRDIVSHGHQFFKGIVTAQNVGSSSPAVVLLGMGENNTYWGLGYIIPLLSNGCITVGGVTLGNSMYLKITPTTSCMINLLLDKQFQYYIGTDPTASDAVWTTVD